MPDGWTGHFVGMFLGISTNQERVTQTLAMVDLTYQPSLTFEGFLRFARSMTCLSYSDQAHTFVENLSLGACRGIIGHIKSGFIFVQHLRGF